MGGFFSFDNPVFHVINKIVDMIIISMIYLIVCIPIITIGPATTALYYTAVKVLRRERGYLSREFFHSFKENFKVGTIVTIILVVLYSVLMFDIKYAKNLSAQGSMQGSILLYIFSVFFITVTFITIYIFPVLSRFTLGVKQLFKDAFLMSIRHLPSTILMAVLLFICIFVTYCFYIPIILFPALCLFLQSFIMERILKKYMPESEEDPEETGKDEWYLE